LKFLGCAHARLPFWLSSARRPASVHPNPGDLDRLAASFHHLALCCRKLAPDKARQHPTAEAMAEDKQFFVGAVPAAGEQL
jgi:hypothetical protein